MPRILLVDDHPLLRGGLRRLMESEIDLSVCGESASVKEALGMVEALQPDLVLTDLSFPTGSGMELVQRLKLDHPLTKVVVLSMHDESRYADQVMRAGASAYLTKDIPPNRLLASIRAVLAEEPAAAEPAELW